LIDAPLTLTRAFIPGWRERGRGALLNVASTGAFQPGPQTAVYYAAKAFFMNWSVALAREEHGWLTVTTLCPGALKTGFSAAAGKSEVPGAPGPGRTARIAVRAWKRNRGLVVPGLTNKILVFLSRVAPVAATAAVVEALQLAVRKR
jgi:short-subunit dehydrogenase